MSLKIRKRNACVALCAGMIATAALAEERKDVPASPELDEATSHIIRKQEKLSSAASEIRWEIEKSWDADGGGAGGYNAIRLEDDGVVLRWKGKLPRGVAQAVKRAQRTASVRVEPARYSRIELKAAARRVGEFVEAQSKSGRPYHAVWVVDDDKVRVSVAPGNELLAARAALPEVAVPVEVQHAERLQLNSRYNDSAPWWGGARFISERNGVVRAECTTGFGVTNGSSEYLLTAAHCGTYPDRTRDPTWEYMGYSGRENWRHDVLLIQDTNAGNRIYDGGVGTGEFSKRVAGWDWVYQGDFLCHSGSTSGVICGFRPVAWAERIHGCDSDGDCFWIDDLIAANLSDGRLAARGGDSGGPVFFPRSDGRVTAKGTVTGITHSNQMLFQDFGTAWRDFGVWPIVN